MYASWLRGQNTPDRSLNLGSVYVAAKRGRRCVEGSGHSRFNDTVQQECNIASMILAVTAWNSYT